MTMIILAKRLVILRTNLTRNLLTHLSTVHKSNENSNGSHRDIDWTRVLALTASENQDTVLKARSRHADLQSAITEAKEQPQEIDFEDFRSRKVDDSLIAKVQAAVESYKPHKVEIADKMTKIQKDRVEAAKHSAEYIAQLEIELTEKEAKLEIVKAAKPPEEMTVHITMLYNYI